MAVHVLGLPAVTHSLGTQPPGALPDQVASVGIAAHIWSAAENGPRGQGGHDQAFLSSAESGIWLCATHAREVDTNEGAAYPASLLVRWKELQEARILRERGGVSIGCSLLRICRPGLHLRATWCRWYWTAKDTNSALRVCGRSKSAPGQISDAAAVVVRRVDARPLLVGHCTSHQRPDCRSGAVLGSREVGSNVGSSGAAGLTIAHSERELDQWGGFQV